MIIKKIRIKQLNKSNNSKRIICTKNLKLFFNSYFTELKIKICEIRYKSVKDNEIYNINHEFQL